MDWVSNLVPVFREKMLNPNCNGISKPSVYQQSVAMYKHTYSAVEVLQRHVSKSFMGGHVASFPAAADQKYDVCALRLSCLPC